MPNLTGSAQIFGGEVFSSSATAKHGLGTYAEDRTGRGFRYVKAGATALVVGDCIQAAAQLTTHQNLTPSAAAIGATSISVTLGAAATTANQYAGGYAIIDTTPGLGIAYPISGHPAADASAAVVITLPSDSPIRVALTSSSRVTLTANPFSAVIQTPVTTLTGAVVGVAVHPIAAGEYGWVQTRGVAAVLIAGTPAVGQAVSCPTTSAGAAAINSGTLPIIGTILVTGQAGLCQPVRLTID